MMKEFMDKDFMLQTDTANELYNLYAKEAPIVDFHCHIDPKEIYEDKRFDSITALLLGEGGSYSGDHYKWRLMRSCGVEEEYITGTAADDKRFKKWAECLERAIGNPLYHWSHLELKKYFGYNGQLTSENAREVYGLCNARLASKDMSVRGLIQKSKVSLICTTDDPADSLVWHKKLLDDNSFAIKVLPAFRPDKAKDIEKDGFASYIEALSEAADIDIKSFRDLKEALSKRMDFFAALGCKVSDNGMESMEYVTASESDIEAIFSRALSGKTPSREEAAKYHTALLLFLGFEYSRRGWVMQLHYGAKRNNNTAAYKKMGADTGYDCIYGTPSSAQLADFLDALEQEDALSKTIVYNLNPEENAAINSVIGCFQDSSARGKIQQGPAWWFCDNARGIENQLRSLAEQGSLGDFVGMNTDSRSFLSYTRHEYFRRILCNLLGDWTEQGMYPQDYNALGRIVSAISFENAVRYFGFEL